MDTGKLLLTNRHLSRYNPLKRILFYDDFDEGVHGWTELVSNHAGDLQNLRPGMTDLRPAQLSNCNFFDVGSHGSLEGNYALKLATRARINSQAVLIKRLTSVQKGLVQFETYFTFKAEQTSADPELLKQWDGNEDPSERHFGEFTLSNDICEGDGQARYMHVLRYVNADPEGNYVKRWFYKTSLHSTTKMKRAGNNRFEGDIHVQSEDDWQPVPGGEQGLCFNETATKINWHYLRWKFDTQNRINVELQVNDMVLDLTAIPIPMYDQNYVGLTNLLNFLVDVRTRTNVRNFLYLDSVVVSVDW